MAGKKRPETPTQPKDEPSLGKRITGTQFAGIVLVAAALFNIPKIVLPAVTTEDQMMIVVLSAMFLAGLILLGLPVILEKLNSRKK